MTIPYHIQIRDPLTEKEIQSVTTVIENCFNFLDTQLNHWNPSSVISIFNKSKAYTQIHFDSLSIPLFTFANKLFHLTNGRFDPSRQKLIQQWKLSLNADMLPRTENIEQFNNISWKNICYKCNSFYKENDLIALDFDSISKGFLVDILVEELKNKGIQNLLVEWGGEIKGYGTKSKTSPWKVAFSTDGNKVLTVPLFNTSIATSGLHQQLWAIEENNSTNLYSHLILNETNRPIEVDKALNQQITVLNKSCMIADGIATAALLFQDQDELLDWIKKIKIEYKQTRIWLNNKEIKSHD